MQRHNFQMFLVTLVFHSVFQDSFVDCLLGDLFFENFDLDLEHSDLVRCFLGLGFDNIKALFEELVGFLEVELSFADKAKLVWD